MQRRIGIDKAQDLSAGCARAAVARRGDATLLDIDYASAVCERNFSGAIR